MPSTPSEVNPRNGSLPGLLAAVLFVVSIARVWFLAKLPDEKLVQHIPDDGFYYLVLARNFAASHRWTFDGTAPATGFHLLWAYGIALLYRVDPTLTLHHLFLVAGFAGSLALAIAAGLAGSAMQVRFGDTATVGVSFVFFSAASLMQSAWLMESPFGLLFAAAYIYVLSRRHDRFNVGIALFAAFLGFCGMMARSDFGLLTFCIAFTYAVAAWRDREHLPAFKMTAVGFVGACIGAATVVLHSYAISGHFSQGSAKQKLFWSHVEGFSFRRALQVAFSFSYALADVNLSAIEYRELLYLSLVLRVVILCTGAILVGRALLKTREPLLWAMTLTVIAYVCLYRFDSAAVQPWYAANFEIPAAVLAAAGWAQIRGKLAKNLAAGFATMWAFVGVLASCQPTWSAQSGHYEAAIYLRGHPELSPVGAWNAGILSYFSGSPVINLDGLVNDDIYSYTVSNRLDAYIALRQVRYIFDSPAMFTGFGPRRGGYDGDRLLQCLTERQNTPTGENAPPSLRRTLYQVDLSCVGGNGRAAKDSPAPDRAYETARRSGTAPLRAFEQAR